jgi:hypothetical protein
MHCFPKKGNITLKTDLCLNCLSSFFHTHNLSSPSSLPCLAPCSFPTANYDLRCITATVYDPPVEAVVESRPKRSVSTHGHQQPPTQSPSIFLFNYKCYLQPCGHAVKYKVHIRFEVFMEVTMKNTVLRNFVDYTLFRQSTQTWRQGCQYHPPATLYNPQKYICF